MIFYKVCMYLHMFSGFLATFLLFPINLLNRKGSSFHRFIGKATIYSTLVLTGAGLLMLLNPLFPNQFALVSKKHHWESFFAATYYEPAFFIWLDIITLYMVGSGVRIWSRIKSIYRQQPSYNYLDIFLVIAMAISSLFFIFIGFVDAKSHHPFSNVFIILGFYLLLLSILDLWTFRSSCQNFLLKWGWIIHGYKMLFVWHGLITAYSLRMNVASPIDTTHPILSVSTRLVTIVVFFFYWKSKQNESS